MGIFYGVGLFAGIDNGPIKLPGEEQGVTEPNEDDSSGGNNPSTKKPPIVGKQDKVVNVLAFGLNDGLADTITLFSYNYGINVLNVLTIPRDTYWEVEGHYEPWQRKINSVYGYREDGGPLGMKKQVSKLLGIPIDYYVELQFDSVVAIVDTLGGYDVYVPYPMHYDDVYASPELHIHFDEGWQHLDGYDTLKYLRFRKNNDGTIVEGDVQRTSRQRDFIISMIEQALSNDLVGLLTTIAKGEYVGTDMPIEEVLRYATLIKNIDMDSVRTYILEGDHGMQDELSYWFVDDGKKKALMRLFYSTNPKDFEETNEEEGEGE